MSLTTLAVNSSPALYGRPWILTATVVPTSASGRVTFYDGAVVLGAVAVINGRAALTTARLGTGDRRLTARYGGDTQYLPSTSAVTPLRVNAWPGSGLTMLGNTAVGLTPIAVVTADFNGDGIADLAVVNAGESSISILLGLGNGTFQRSVTPLTGAAPFDLIAGDFNSDGKTDLAAVNNADSTFSILIGNGDGSFNSSFTDGAGNNPVSIAAADFNNDGILDLAICNFDDDTVTILLGNGDGDFTWAAAVPVGLGPVSAVVGDFNGDGTADLAVANWLDNTVSRLLGRGDGNFTVSTLLTGLGPLAIASGDVNGDGYPDIVTANYGDPVSAAGGGVSVLLGNGDGTFGGAILSDTGESPEAIVLGDINGDGRLDAVAVSVTGVSVLLGNSDGSFAAPQKYAAGSPVAIALGEFNGDGSPDVAVVNVADNNISVFVGNPVAVPSPGASATGNLDRGDCGSITGWAWDPSQPATPLAVDILNNGNPVTTILAGLPRPDLANIAGNGNHGFSIPTPASFRDGSLHAITVRLSGTNVTLPGFFRLACLSSAATGYMDVANCSDISGWAWDPARPNWSVSVDILDNGSRISTLPANLPRADLVNVVGNGVHEFSGATPARVRDGNFHVLTAVISGTSSVVSAPATNTCGSVAPANKIWNSVAVFRSGTWWADVNGDFQWTLGVDSGFIYGAAGDIPVVGDWDNTGVLRIGVFRSGVWYVDLNNDHSWDSVHDAGFVFGQAGDIPVLGDWDGTGVLRIGVFRNGQWRVDINNDHQWDSVHDTAFIFGQSGDIPVVGDWDGTGVLRIGVFRSGQWWVDINNDHLWDSVHDTGFVYGQAGDVPLIGDWTNSGVLRIGVFRDGQWWLDANNDHLWTGGTDIGFGFALPTDIPVILRYPR